MRGAGVEVIKKGPRGRRHHRHLVVLAREGPHGIQRVEPHQGDELLAVAGVSPQQLDALVAVDPGGPRSLEDLGAQQSFVRVGIRGDRPPVPDAADHRISPFDKSL